MEQYIVQYIDKSDLVAEIERRWNICKKVFFDLRTEENKDYYQGKAEAYKETLYFLDTLEVKEEGFGTEVYKYIDEHFNMYDDGNQTLQTKDKKSLIGRVDAENIAKYFFELGLKAQSKDIIEALHTEYEKGRADVIADTISWLANVWPQYCDNPNIIDAFKENVIKY